MDRKKNRQDVATLGPGWNKTLLNYALAMRALDALPITDRTSWKFLGAMHGFDRNLWIREGLISPADPIPRDLINRTYGNQCQHGSWYFLPWHRGYLYAFEEIVANKVKELTGDDWALPYWNYLDNTNPNARRVPDAFLTPRLPDGSSNPLAKYPRRPNLVELQPGPHDAFSLAAMAENDFVVGAAGNIGFGGGVTGTFAQFANWTGQLESNPHNTVHRLVGGQQGGFMADPLLAGLDPIFWLHHCNVDRLWEAWMATPGKTMVRDPRWLNGPADRRFILPSPDGSDPGLTFSGRDTLRNGRLHRSYDDLTKGTGVTPGAQAMARVSMGAPEQQVIEPIGANAAAVRVGGTPVASRVDLDSQATASGFAAMKATAPGTAVSRLYLALESVRGTAPSPLLEVYVNLPEGPTRTRTWSTLPAA